MEIIKKNFKTLLVVGIVLQVFISIITYHPDIRAFVLASKFINQGEVFTFYDHVSKLPSGDKIKQIYGDDIFIYPPLAYLIPAFFYAPFSGFLSTPYEEIIYNDSAIYTRNAYYPAFLIFKLPFILASLLILFLLPKFFDKIEHGQLAQLFWLFSPVNLLVSSGMGQVDVILALFLLTAFFYIKKHSFPAASIFIALSALIKPVGLALLPLIAISAYRKNGLRNAILSILPGVTAWVVLIFPFLLSPAFRMYALFAAHTAKTTYAGIAISGAVSIPWFFIFYSLIALYLFEEKITLIKGLGLATLSVLAFNHFHPQWFLWFMPFLIIYSISKNKLFLFFTLTISWVLIWLSFDPSLHAGMILSFKESLPPTLASPISASSLVLLARAYLAASLVYLLQVKDD